MDTILNVKQASEVLCMSERVLAQKARDGEIPAGKVGSKWLFVYEDLVAYVRSRYLKQRQDAEAQRKEVKKICHSAKEVTSGTSISMHRMDKEYNAALALPTG